jgi:hypothetical protein
MSSLSRLLQNVLCCEETDLYHESLRLAQAGALLHNLGKITSSFLEWQIKGKKGEAPNFKYQHILHLIESDYNESDYNRLATELPKLYQALKEPENINVLDIKTIDLLKRNFKLPFPLNDRPYRLGDLLEYLGQGKIKGKNQLYNEPGKQHFIKNIFPGGSLLTHLMNRAHRGASGGEKKDIRVKQQDTALFRSTPFGWEIPAGDLAKIDDLKRKIEQAIQKHLSCDPFSFQDLQGLSLALNEHMVEALADTQRPLNDVTVWDIGHTAMAFLITQVVSLILQERVIDHDELAQKGAGNSLCWRVLSLRLDGLAYLEGAATLADLRVRSSRLNESLKRARRWLEERSIAVQVYQDENGAFFLFTDAGIDTESFYQTVFEKIRPELNVDGFALLPALSPPLTSHPDDQGGKYAGTYIQEQLARSNLSSGYDLATYTSAWQNDVVDDICVACGIRPQGYGAKEISKYRQNTGYYREKARKRKLCCICMDRRRDVAKKWLAKEESSTVWIDEVADNNGRIALVVGFFDLDNWQPMYPKAKEDRDALVSPSFGRIRRAWETTHHFWKEIKNELGKITGSDSRRIKIKGFYESREKSGRLIPYHAYELILDNTKIGVLWEGAYFITISNLTYIAGQLGYVPPARSSKEIFYAYQKRFQEWGAEAVRETLLNGKRFSVAEPAGYGTQRNNTGVFHVKEVEIAEYSYLPALPILAEPRTFMCMVPADRALDVVKKIKEKYEKKMGKVRNRLPLHLGIVFARRRTPLRAVLEAGRRMLKRKYPKEETWKVTGAVTKNKIEAPGWLQNDPHFTEWKKILLENERSGRVAVWRVPLVMGDGKTRDCWYPYAFTKPADSGLSSRNLFRLENRVLGSADWITHADSLQEQKADSPGDCIYFTPSTFDFEFLDTSGRRFAIVYDEKGRRVEFYRRQRPYLLDELEDLEYIWNKLKRSLTKNQIYALCDLIETKRQEWQAGSKDYKMENDTFHQFCRDALASARWQTDWETNEYFFEQANGNPDPKQIKQKWLDKWAGYAANGWLSDAVELYLQILKEEPEIQKEET